MQVTRQEGVFADAIEKMLEAHRSKIFSILTVDGKQERGYAPVIVGKDFLQCRSGMEDSTNDRIYPLAAIVSITPSG